MSPARTAAIGTTLISSAPTNFGRGFRLQRGQISGHRPRLAAHALIEIAASQQEGEQHQRRVEIGMLGVVDGLITDIASASTMPIEIGTSILVRRARSARKDLKNGCPE